MEDDIQTTFSMGAFLPVEKEQFPSIFPCLLQTHTFPFILF